MTTRTPSLFPAREESLPAPEAFLVDLAQWLARVMQYSPGHPSCAAFEERAFASLQRALVKSLLLELAIHKDGVLIGEVAATHRAVTTRLAPHLYHRGVQGLRVTGVATAADLAAFIELLALRVQTTFDEGGLRRLVMDRAIHGIEIDEIAHDVDVVEREAQRQRRHLRAAFAEGLRAARGGRWLRGLSGDTLLELLDQPEIAVLVLEEDALGLAEAVAGLCLMVQQEEARSGRVLYPKLRAILLALSPPSHAKILMGLPPLVGPFRAALLWALDGLLEPELARIALPAVRTHASELDLVLYAASIVAPHDGRRLSTFRWLALHLHDLSATDGADADLLAILAQPVDEADSYRRERLCLQAEAARLSARRLAREAPTGTPKTGADAPAVDARRVMSDLMAIACQAPGFERVCERLPAAADLLYADGSTGALLGILSGLQAPLAQGKEGTAFAIEAIAMPDVAASILADLERRSASLEGAALDDLHASIALLVTHCAEQVWDCLEQSTSLKMQRALLEALGAAGPRLLPLVRQKLRSPNVDAVRHAVALLARLGAKPVDLAVAARHANERVRREFIRVLRSMALDEAAMDLLVELVTDESPELRTAARLLLRGDLLRPPAIAELYRMADDSDRPMELRERIVEVLASSRRDEAAKALFDLIHPHGLIDLGSIRDLAAAALRRSPAPKARAYFEEGLRSPMRRVRWACEKAAGGG